jgi:hypothetical protein
VLFEAYTLNWFIQFELKNHFSKFDDFRTCIFLVPSCCALTMGIFFLAIPPPSDLGELQKKVLVDENLECKL